MYRNDKTNSNVESLLCIETTKIKVMLKVHIVQK